nr:hypothetical protein [Tanacetum cinerariifolium]
MDVKSAFLYGTIDEEVYVIQPPGFQDPEFPHRVYKVEKAMYGLHQAPRAWYGTSSKYLLDNGFQRGTIDQTLFIRKHKGEFLLVQVYTDIRAAKTPMDRENPWGKDGTGKDVELHLYRSMIGSLMYLTASRPDIMFAVRACARHQVTPKECHLHAVKRIFRYLKGNPKLGLWYPKESPFDLVAYSNSDYSGANQDRKSTTGEYVAVASGCGQVLLIQNQLLDYGHSRVWSTARVKTTDGETNVLAKVNGRKKIVSESSIRRHLKLNNEEGISTLPDNELFENLSLMGYNILPIQRRCQIWEAFPTDTSLDVGQDRENISKTFALPYKELPRVTSLGGGEGNEMSHVLGTLGAANILASGGLRLVFTTASTGVSHAVATASESFPTAAIFATASVATPTTRVTRSSRGVVIGSSSLIFANIPTISKKDKGKGKMTDVEQPSKEKVLEQMSVQPARDLEAKFAQEDQIIREQAERDSAIARIHAEKELEMMIIEIDRSNEMVAKYLSEYEQVEAGLSHDVKVELINELLMYQRHLAQIKKYQAQQNKPATKTERRNFYMSILKSNAVWEKMQDFVPMNSKIESKRLKRPRVQLDKERFKKLKTAGASGIEPTQEQQSKEPKELSEEELKNDEVNANPIRTLGDYSKPRHAGYRNAIELPEGNNVVPLRSDTIRICLHMRGSDYSFPCSILSIEKDRKTPQQYLNVPTTSKRISLRSMDPLQGLTTKNNVADGKLRNKSTDESWEIIENLALYDHEGWNDSKSFVKPVKAIFTTQNTSKAPDRRLLKLEDQINFLLKGSRLAPRPSSIHTPQAYAEEMINDRMAEMFGLLKKLTTSRASDKVLIREEAKHLVTKNVNSISLTRGKEEKNDEDNVMTHDGIEKTSKTDPKMPVKEADKEAKNGTKTNQSKELKELSLASHSYIYPLGIAKYVLVDVAGYVYPVDFMILDIREDEKRPFILGTPFLTTAKAVIKFDKGTVTLRSGKSKISFDRIHESLGKVEKGIKNDIEPIAPTMTVNRLVLE